MSTRDQDMERVQACANQLMEHFDSVQIFVTRHEEVESQGTVNINLGAGNYFTRSGHVREWIIKQDQQARQEIIDR